MAAKTAKKALGSGGRGGGGVGDGEASCGDGGEEQGVIAS